MDDHSFRFGDHGRMRLHFLIEQISNMDWQSYLGRLNQHLLAKLDHQELVDLQEAASIVDYLGYPPATINQIEETQIRLGFELPNSLKHFYIASNGWHAADGFPVGIANVLPVTELFLLSNCPMRVPEICSDSVEKYFGGLASENPINRLKDCVVIIDLDGNELGFAVRTESLADWPVVTYNPDGDGFEIYDGFVDLMKQGETY